MSAIAATASRGRRRASVYVPYTLRRRNGRGRRRCPDHPDRRRLIKVDVASAERIAPFCPHFGVCGGCAIQHWDAARYRAWKRELVVTTLAQAGNRCDGRRRWSTPMATAAAASRCMRGWERTRCSRSALPRPGSHDIMPIDRCPILDPQLDGAIEAAWAIAEPLIAMGKPLDIQVTATDSGLDVDVRGSGPLSTARDREAVAHRRAASAGAADAPRRAGADATPPIDRDRRRAGRAAARLVPAGDGGGRGGARARWWRTHCKRGKHIADLFCGVGPFALRLAAKSRDRRLRQRRRRDRRACRRPRHRRRD